MRAASFLILNSAFLILPRLRRVIGTLPVPVAHTWPPWPPRPTSPWRHPQTSFYRPTTKTLGQLGHLPLAQFQPNFYKTTSEMNSKRRFYQTTTADANAPPMVAMRTLRAARPRNPHSPISNPQFATPCRPIHDPRSTAGSRQSSVVSWAALVPLWPRWATQCSNSLAAFG
jgi:hypothetical protein